MSNARHALNKKDPAPYISKYILIDARLLRKNNAEHIELRVKDLGCGIPRQNLEKIFTPFFTDKNRGSGLGLAIAKNIIEKHEGQITVNSQEGAGSTFTLSFSNILQ